MPRPDWSAENPGNQAIHREVLDAVLPIVQRRPPGLVDIGSGSGWWLNAIHERSATAGPFAGIDLDPARVTATLARGADADVRVGDAPAAVE